MSSPIALDGVRRPRPRFARAVNIERDAGTRDALLNFLPVGRALDVVDKIMASLRTPGIESAFAVTGPYGSGKSSLALLLDALLAPAEAEEFSLAVRLLSEASPGLLEKVEAARGGHSDSGLLRCFVTAQREPVGRTVLRALIAGCSKASPPARLLELELEARRLLDADELDTREVVELMARASTVRPLVLLIDEFGKSLEAVAGSGAHADADLFLLQELAERSFRSDYAVVTLQHLAIGDYATELGASQRREWAKVQGRFEELSYVEGQAQTLQLIGAAFEPISHPQARDVITQWSEAAAETASALGLSQVDATLLAGAWPLHPTALVVLPDLVQRYGQNERTLFSFLAAPGSNSVVEWLAETTWDETHLPSIRLSHLYDYFVASATAMSSYSAAASRWLEIDMRIRDARGLTPPQLRVLKGVGLLNLVAAGGELRASREMIGWALADGCPGTSAPQEVAERLVELEVTGLLNWRAFSDEYRVWHGSDYDVRSAIERVREQLQQVPVPPMLQSNVPLVPVVAARHSHVTATLRAFDCRWTGALITADDLIMSESTDGLVLLSVGGSPELDGHVAVEALRPVVIVDFGSASDIVSTAREAEALRRLLEEAPKEDWVIQRELRERQAETRATLDVLVDQQLQRVATAGHGYFGIRSGEVVGLTARQPLSSLLSEVCDEAYQYAPVVRNELLNRHQLSSQATKARRELLAALLIHPDLPDLGLTGFGPEVSMYRSVLMSTGIHSRSDDGSWKLRAPSHTQGGSSFHPVWNRLLEILGTTHERVSVAEAFERLAMPPFGLREGVAPVLLTCALIVQAGEVALYEHGTFKPTLTDDMLERLVRNPQHFQVRHFDAAAGPRRALVEACAAALTAFSPTTRIVAPTVVGVVAGLVRFVNALPEYSRRSAAAFPADVTALRLAITRATEPDVLLFQDLPRALDLSEADPSAFTVRLIEALKTMRGAYPALLQDVRKGLVEATRAFTGDLRVELAQRAAPLKGKVLDPRLGTLVTALAADLDDDAWLEYVAMMVANTAPSTWRDEDVARYRVNVSQLGGAFRRLEALTDAAQAAANQNGFRAVLISVTEADGKDTSHLVRVHDQHRTGLAAIMTKALEDAAHLVGSIHEAREAVLALLAVPEDSVSSSGQTDGAQPPMIQKAGT